MQQRKKYFFFDIDGTLVPQLGGSSVPESTKAAIDELRARGHFCAIATGRAHCLAEGQCRELGFDSMVCDGGNGVMLEGKLLGIDPLDREACIELARECEELGFYWAVSPENRPVRYTPKQEFADMVGTYYMTTRVVKNLDIASFPEILKMYVACKPGEEEKIRALKKLSWARYHPEYIFVEPTDKSIGIRRVMDHYQAPYEDVVVFGDGTNDLAMFISEWTSVAMGNAVPELKERADFVTKDAADDGIAYALRHYGWIE